MNKIWKTILIIGIVIVGVFLIIQLIPYGRVHNNPEVGQEPAWDTPQTRELAKRACFDCHSNETVWPWYSNIAPVSWLVMKDVEEGRRFLNFSQWGSGGGERGEGLREAGEVVYSGNMPPAKYLMMHPLARLTDAEKKSLVDGLARTK